MIQIMRRWVDLGVDGFRLGAIPYLCEREGTNNENLPETHAIIKKIRSALDSYIPGKVLLAEANQWPEDVIAYFGDGDECHMVYHFPLMPRIYMAITQEDRFPITDILRQTPDIPANCQWTLFLRNHDELTLETDVGQSLRRRELPRFSADSKMIRLRSISKQSLIFAGLSAQSGWKQDQVERILALWLISHPNQPIYDLCR